MQLLSIFFLQKRLKGPLYSSPFCPLRSLVVLVTLAPFAADYDRLAMQATEGVPVKPIIQVILDASNVNMATSATAYLQSILLGAKAQQAMFETRMLALSMLQVTLNHICYT